MAGSKDSQLSPLASSSRRNNAWHDVLETLGCIGSPAAAGLRAESLACIDVGTMQDLQEGLRQQDVAMLH